MIATGSCKAVIWRIPQFEVHFKFGSAQTAMSIFDSDTHANADRWTIAIGGLWLLYCLRSQEYYAYVPKRVWICNSFSLFSPRKLAKRGKDKGWKGKSSASRSWRDKQDYCDSRNSPFPFNFHTTFFQIFDRCDLLLFTTILRPVRHTCPPYRNV